MAPKYCPNLQFMVYVLLLQVILDATDSSCVTVPVIDLPSDASELLIKTLLGTLIDAHQQVRVCGVNAVGSVFKESKVVYSISIVG
jgi:hypothetical protein